MRETGAKGMALQRGKFGYCSRNGTNAASGSGVSAASSVCEVAAVAKGIVAENANTNAFLPQRAQRKGR